MRICVFVSGRSQRGSVLLEYMLVMTLALLAAVWAVGAWADKKTELRITSTALWMQALQQASERYIEDYGPQLINAAPYSSVVLNGHWVADWQQPTLDELQQLGLLSPAFTHFTEPPARIWVFPQEPCLGGNCFLHALIVVDEPLQKSSGVADAQGLDLWREATDGSGLTVQAPYEQWLAGPHFRWPNQFAQQGQLPEGTIALAVHGEQLWLRYLRVRDERDPQFQNHLTVQGQVHSKTAVRSDGYIAMGLEAENGQTCNQVGAIAHDAHLPTLLLCREGQWQQAMARDGGYFISNQYGQCSHPTLGNTANPVIGACGCAPGYMPTIIAVFEDELSNYYRSHLCRPAFENY
ncbi:MAG TPA: hypothetical protein VK051_04395 [Paenalcaligenes sp.]|nr:hypothetical protein [Paenalcaligenes sp.]